MGVDRDKAKVVVVGDRGVGKRSLVRRSAFDPIDDRYLETLGAKVSKKEILLPVRLRDGTYLDMVLWTIQEPALRGRAASFARSALGILAVCDTTRRSTLDHLPELIEVVYAVSGEQPIVIVANKWDLVEWREVEESAVRRLAEAYRANLFLTSARSGENVEAAFQALGERIAELRRANASGSGPTDVHTRGWPRR